MAAADPFRSKLMELIVIFLIAIFAAEIGLWD